MAKRRMISNDWIEALGRWPKSSAEEKAGETEERVEPELISLEDVPESVLGVLPGSGDSTPKGIRIELSVREALKKLGEEERELVERYLLAGQPMTELAELTGRRVHRLTTQYGRALRKLRKHLAPLVAREFGVEVSRNEQSAKNQIERSVCPICLSSHREAIDELIANRPVGSTWRPVISQLRTEYGIVITTPQILLGHHRYH